MTEHEDDIFPLVVKRFYDMWGTLKNLKVFLNGEPPPVRNFKKYIKLYLLSDEQIVRSIANDRREVGFAVADEQFNPVSFVNSISTSKGGTHVNHVVDQLIDPIVEVIRKEVKNLDAMPYHAESNVLYL